jgi:hypothetical protein
VSDTPRTDAAEAAWERDGGGSVQRLFSLARQLERELAAMTDYAELASDVIKRAKVMGERP